MRKSKTTSIALASTIAIIGAADLSAHRRDEYLQAARFAVAPERVEVELDLTPGAAIAEALIADIDRDRDGVLSDAEKRDYVASAAGAIDLSIDGQPLRVEPAVEAFPDAMALRSGDVAIRLRATASLPKLSQGAHQLTFRNRHRPDISVYLANALVPESGRIGITAQDRDGEQSALTIHYLVGGEQARPLALWMIFPIGVVCWTIARRRSLRSPLKA